MEEQTQEPLFQNTYVRDLETAKEFYRYCFYQRPFDKCITIFFGVMLVLNVAAAIVLSPGFGYNAAMCAVFLVLNYLRYQISSYTMCKRDREMVGDEFKVTLVVDMDCLKHLEPTESLPLELSKIKLAVQTKHYFFLITKTKMSVFLHREGFTLGNQETFRSFLKQKNIPLKTVR